MLNFYPETLLDLFTNYSSFGCNFFLHFLFVRSCILYSHINSFIFALGVMHLRFMHIIVSIIISFILLLISIPFNGCIRACFFSIYEMYL